MGNIIKEEFDKVAFDNFGFVSAAESIRHEEAERIEKASKKQFFGINFLDDSLRGIAVDDFVLLGALPGCGKTTLATQIALSNVVQGKTVHFFALEASKREIERRIKFGIVMWLYYKETNDYEFRISQADYEDMVGHKRLQKYSDQANAMISKYKNLFIYYLNDNDFGIKEFKKKFNGIASKTDLIIVDHLHYFDLDDRDENKAVKDILKQMRNLVLIHETPIVLIAHLKKPDKKLTTLVPDLDDFHGTSEIGKIVTKALTVGPGEHQGSGVMASYFRVAKNRSDSGSKHYIIKALWDSKINKYKDGYELGKDVNGVFDSLTDANPKDLPTWLTAKKYREEV